MIKKPHTDSREYSTLILNNGLEVLLISDEAADKASAALDVNVGSLQDPKEIPGLAHFCEHLLFMGTKTYPSENEYSSFLSQHGGRSNAFTAGDHTNYYFDIHAEYLEGALDRFSKFFIEPLFLDSCIDRELQAVHSEHEKNLNSDTWKIYQLLKYISDPKHPFCSFSTGNLQTLRDDPIAKGINLREWLLDFHSKLYSANTMKLVILGKEPVSVLEKWARAMFSGIESKDVSPTVFQIPCREGQLQKMILQKSVKDLRNVILLFPCPDYHDNYKTRPLSYFSHMLGHESAGSILSLLKKKGLAQSLNSGPSFYGSRGFEFFKITIEVTELGLANYQDVVAIVFQYLELLKSHGIAEWIYNECRTINRNFFAFREKISPSSYTSNLAGYMHKFAVEDFLQGNSMMEVYDETLLKDALSHLTPHNFLLMIQSNLIEAEFKEAELWEVEYWYKTKFNVSPFEESFANVSILELI
jgi:insulysin